LREEPKELSTLRPRHAKEHPLDHRLACCREIRGFTDRPGCCTKVNPASARIVGIDRPLNESRPHHPVEDVRERGRSHCQLVLQLAMLLPVLVQQKLNHIELRGGEPEGADRVIDRAAHCKRGAFQAQGRVGHANRLWQKSL
jgi:hypothetical protein